MQSSWWYRSTETGAQIDLLIDRADNCITICEMKFSGKQCVISRHYARELEKKVELFRNATHTRKTLFLTLVTTFGCSHNDHYERIVASEVTADHLFAS